MFLLPCSPHRVPCNLFQFLDKLNIEDWFIIHLSKAGRCFPRDRADIAFSSPDCAHDLGLPSHQTRSAPKKWHFGGCGDGSALQGPFRWGAVGDDTTICWTFLLVDGFPAEFYKIFKEDLMLINIPQTIPQYRIIKNIVPIKWHNYPDIQIT